MMGSHQSYAISYCERFVQTMKFFLILVAVVACASAMPRDTLPRWPVNVWLTKNIKMMPEIVGGDVAAKGEFPWQISMQSVSSFGRSHHCGASIYNERWIVSAAHCVEHVHPSKLILIAGEYDLTTADGDEQELPIETIVWHESFNSKTFQNDIALLKTTIPVVFNDLVQPIALPAAGKLVPEDTIVTVSGWGTLQSGDSTLPALLHKVDVPVVSDAKCRDAYGVTDITDSMICGGLDAGGKDSCQGDSGGPLVTREPLELVGIVSWGNGCALPGYPGVYTEVSYFIDWIAQTIANN